MSEDSGIKTHELPKVSAGIAAKMVYLNLTRMHIELGEQLKYMGHVLSHFLDGPEVLKKDENGNARSLTIKEINEILPQRQE